MQILPYLVAAYVFLVGCYGLATSRNLIHTVGCLSVCQAATYVLLLAVGYRDARPPPSSPTSSRDPGRWWIRWCRPSPSPTSSSARP